MGKNTNFGANTKSVASNFISRTNADIFRVLSLALREKVANPALADAAIVRVDTAPDLGNCKIFVTGEVAAFEKLTAMFKAEIANNLKIKRVPSLKFVVDNGDKNTLRVEELLKQIKEKNGL